MDLIVNTRTARWQTYAIAFVITAAIFATAVYVSNRLNSARLSEIRAAQDSISTDILSLETQFELLAEHSCTNIAENTTLPSELQTLGNRLSYMENQETTDQGEVRRLKRLYSLLEIKDYLLMKRVAGRCKLKPIFILYFYSNDRDCKDCQKQGYVLTALSGDYPQLRIYSFDYDLDVSALKTLISIDSIENNLPALVINGKTYYGFQSIDSIEKIVPQLAAIKRAASTSATSTVKKN